MTKKIIAIDIDDVIAASTEAVRLIVNQRTGADLEAEHYQVPGDYWGYYERVWREHGIDFKLPDDEMIIDQSHVPLLPGANFAIAELAERFHIVLITARHSTWEKATRKWLSAQGLLQDTDLHFAGNIDEKRLTKGEVCIKIGATWLIDDNPEHCQTAIENGVEPILFGEYGWHHKAKNHFIHCKSWSEVLEFFDGKD